MKKIMLLILAFSICVSLVSCVSEGGTSNVPQGTTDNSASPPTPGTNPNLNSPDTSEPPDTSEHCCAGNNWVIAEEASCTKERLKQFVCSCGKIVDTEAIAKVSHTFTDGLCSTCGSPDPDYNPEPSVGLVFESWGDGSCWVVGMGTCTDTDIVIPEKSPEGDTVVGVIGDIFSGLNGSYTLRIPGSVTEMHFWECPQLSKIFIEEGVTAIGDEAFANCTNLTMVSVGSSVKNIGIDAFRECISLTNIFLRNGLEYIGQNAFFGCSSLTEISIPETVETIAGGVFQGCTSLQQIIIPDDVALVDSYTFMDCTSLKRVILGANVTEIGQFAFANCTSLTDITIPKRLKKMREWAFKSCGYITSVYIEDLYSWCDISVMNGDADLLAYGADLYLKNELLTNLVIPDDLTHFGSSFEGCTSLESVMIPEGTTEISNSAFAGCINLSYVNIPSTVETIGNNAFSNCMKLTNITIPSSVSSIGQRAFYQCEALNDVVIPKSVSSLGARVFENCTSLTQITIDSEVVLSYSSLLVGCNSLEKINVPEHLTQEYLNASGWNNMSSLIQMPSQGGSTVIVSVGLEFTSNKDGTCKLTGIGTCTDTIIVIPETSPVGDTVVEIGPKAFERCYKITEVVIPNTVTKIWGGAFDYCSSLQSLDIPESVTVFNAGIYYCPSLKVLILRSPAVFNYPNPPIHEIDDSYERMTAIYVPAELVDEYRNTFGWKIFGEKIQAITE